ncbi:hypothetical protein ABPG74_012778 [Tetrahymena malaccensis]
MNQIDEHDADMEIERIKTRIFNRNSETKKQEESPKKIEQVPNKKDNQRTQEIDTKETKKINKKHPIYNSSESSEEDVKTPKNIINPLQKTNKGVNNQIKTKNDKINQENDEESENKKNQKNLIPIKERNMQNEQIKNRKVEKQEDESLKALEQISQNKINFKENIKKLKQIFKNNFDLQKCKDEDEEGQDQIQQKADKQNQYQQNQNQIQYQQGRESELEYSQDHQNFFYDEDTITTKEHIIINDQSENFIGRRKPQSYSQQFGVDNDEIADMDSEVFNISPDHHPQNDHRLNSIPDENHTISIFNENQSLQASFLEQSIFQKSPRQSQAVSNSNNTFSQQINKRASPSPILNTQIQGQILQDSFNKNPQNHRQNNQKSVTQPLVQSLQTQSQSDNSQSYNKMSQGQINNLLVNRTQQYVQQDLQSSYQHNNASNLSYSQSMHEQSQINYNEPKKYQSKQKKLILQQNIIYINQMISNTRITMQMQERGYYHQLKKRMKNYKKYMNRIQSYKNFSKKKVVQNLNQANGKISCKNLIDNRAIFNEQFNLDFLYEFESQQLESLFKRFKRARDFSLFQRLINQKLLKNELKLFYKCYQLISQLIYLNRSSQKERRKTNNNYLLRLLYQLIQFDNQYLLLYLQFIMHQFIFFQFMYFLLFILVVVVVFVYLFIYQQVNQIFQGFFQFCLIHL